MKKLTIFTPTYNRSKNLLISYRNLCDQTCKDFVWQIVDDGSTDDTENLVATWIKKSNIEIEYIKQSNGGKYRAINKGIKNCRTKWFAFLDSDDYLLKDTVKKIYTYIEKTENNTSIAGIVARRQKENGDIVGKKIDLIEKSINFNELTRKYRFSGDTCRIYKTDILKQNLYPECYKDKFIPENVMLSKIDTKYNIYFVNEAFSVSEYLEGGYTKKYKKLLKNNPYGYYLSQEVSIYSEGKLLKKIKKILTYLAWAKKNNYEINIKKDLLTISLIPFAYCLEFLKIPKWWYKDE